MVPKIIVQNFTKISYTGFWNKAHTQFWVQLGIKMSHFGAKKGFCKYSPLSTWFTCSALSLCKILKNSLEQISTKKAYEVSGPIRAKIVPFWIQFISNHSILWPSWLWFCKKNFKKIIGMDGKKMMWKEKILS